MAEQAALTKRQVVTELTRAPHGQLAEYLPVGRQAVAEDPFFYAHLVAWNHAHGQVRDAKVALPVIAFGASALGAASDPALVESALAHWADLGPREFARAVAFAREAGAYRRQTVARLVVRYLREREALGPQRWEARVGLLHRGTLAGLYKRFHVRPAEWLRAALRSRPATNQPHTPAVAPAPPSVFHALRLAGELSGDELAALAARVPFLVLAGALGARVREPAVLAAVIRGMDFQTAVTNAKRLTALGMQDHEETKAAYAEVLAQKASRKATRGGSLKATRAAEALEEAAAASGDPGPRERAADLAAALRASQERHLAASGGVDGDWLVFGDSSGSMESAIDAARQVAAVLARMVRGRVHLVFGDTTPVAFDATGKTYEEVRQLTRGVRAGGGTALGCGLRLLLDRRAVVDGIAVVSDGGENDQPTFESTYRRYVQQLDAEPTVYWYMVGNVSRGWEAGLKRAGIDVQTFDLTGRFDYTSLPNLVQTMRVGRYSLVDEVMATPLRTLDEVLPRTAGLPVLPRHAPTAAPTVVLP